MNKEAKITICLLAIIFMGFIIYQIDSQHRALINIIQTHENKMDEVLKRYQNVSTDYDSLLNIVDSLPLGSPLDTLKVSSKYGWRRSPLGLGWQMHSGTAVTGPHLHYEVKRFGKRANPSLFVLDN